MKKQTKGAIAAGAAALLLAGGAGTMAAWSDSEALGGGGDVTAGHLRVTQANTDTDGWKWVDGAKDGQPFVPATDLIVPGDKIAYTGTYKLEVAGTNLVASLTSNVTNANITGDLKDKLAITTVSDSDAVDIANITARDNNTLVTVGTQIEFLNQNLQVGADEDVSLAGATVVLQQTAPANSPATP